MTSEGKCGIIAGMIQLLAFVKSLERDYRQVKRGISITYRSSNKHWEEVVTALGMAKPTKHRFVANDGRAPDTTDELINNKRKGKGPG